VFGTYLQKSWASCKGRRTGFPHRPQGSTIPPFPSGTVHDNCLLKKWRAERSTESCAALPCQQTCIRFLRTHFLRPGCCCFAVAWALVLCDGPTARPKESVSEQIKKLPCVRRPKGSQGHNFSQVIWRKRPLGGPKRRCDHSISTCLHKQSTRQGLYSGGLQYGPVTSCCEQQLSQALRTIAYNGTEGFSFQTAFRSHEVLQIFLVS
jgi:hypothetical protein